MERWLDSSWYPRLGLIALLANLMLAAGVAIAAAQQSPAQRSTPSVRPAQPPVAQSQNTTPQQGGPASSDAPQSTTATYSDWIVQCQTLPGPPQQKFCEMNQTSQVQGKNIPFSRVGIAHPVKGQPLRIVVQVPVNVSFATSLRIQTADADPGITAPFTRCVPGGCFVEFELKDEELRKLRAASGSGKLSFADAGGHEISVPLSFNGFAQAFDALTKQ
jgi:invasion protein IalB